MPTQEELLQQELAQSQPKPIGWQDVLMSLIPGYAQGRTNSYNTQMARKQQLQKELGDLMQQAIGRREKIVTAGKVEGTPQQLEQFMTTGKGLEESKAFVSKPVTTTLSPELRTKIKEETGIDVPETMTKEEAKSWMNQAFPKSTGERFLFDAKTGKYYKGEPKPENVIDISKIPDGAKVDRLSQSNYADVRADIFEKGQWQALGKAVNVLNQSSRSQLGIAANSNVRADRILKIVDQPTLTPVDLFNITTDLQGIFQGGAPHEVSIRKGNYSTLANDFANVMTYIKSKPEAINEPGLREKLKQMALDLKTIDNKIIEDNLGVNAVAFRHIINKDPKRWEDMVNSVMKTTELVGEQPKTLPPLTETDIQYNMKTYNKTRQQVIDTYNKKKQGR